MTAADESTWSIDRAALLGATLAAVVALTFSGSGPLDCVATAVGLALPAVLVGYYRLPAASDGQRLPVREALAGLIFLGMRWLANRRQQPPA